LIGFICWEVNGNWHSSLCKTLEKEKLKFFEKSPSSSSENEKNKNNKKKRQNASWVFICAKFLYKNVKHLNLRRNVVK